MPSNLNPSNQKGTAAKKKNVTERFIQESEDKTRENSRKLHSIACYLKDDKISPLTFGLMGVTVRYIDYFPDQNDFNGCAFLEYSKKVYDSIKPKVLLLLSEKNIPILDIRIGQDSDGMDVTRLLINISRA